MTTAVQWRASHLSISVSDELRSGQVSHRRTMPVSFSPGVRDENEESSISAKVSASTFADVMW